MAIEKEFPDFPHSADLLSKFIFAHDLFTIKLKNGQIIHHRPADKASFKQWLVSHKIENIK